MITKKQLLKPRPVIRRWTYYDLLTQHLRCKHETTIEVGEHFGLIADCGLALQWWKFLISPSAQRTDSSYLKVAKLEHLNRTSCLVEVMQQRANFSPRAPRQKLNCLPFEDGRCWKASKDVDLWHIFRCQEQWGSTVVTCRNSSSTGSRCFASRKVRPVRLCSPGFGMLWGLVLQKL